VRSSIPPSFHGDDMLIILFAHLKLVSLPLLPSQVNSFEPCLAPCDPILTFQFPRDVWHSRTIPYFSTGPVEGQNLPGASSDSYSSATTFRPYPKPEIFTFASCRCVRIFLLQVSAGIHWQSDVGGVCLFAHVNPTSSVLMSTCLFLPIRLSLNVHAAPDKSKIATIAVTEENALTLVYFCPC